MIYGALRVSTSQQDTANQKHGILEYANERGGLSSLVFVEDTAGGKIHWRERKFGEMLRNCQAGDTILFAEISRIGRSALQVLEFLHEAAERQVQVHIVKQRMIVDGTMQSKIAVTMLGLAAEIEREFISQRTKEGLARRKAAGVKLGRPAGSKAEQLKLDKEPGKQQIEDWVGKDLGATAVAKLCGCSRSTLYAYCKERGIHLPRRRAGAKKRNNSHAEQNRGDSHSN